jgi:hypothetical protein
MPKPSPALRIVTKKSFFRQQIATAGEDAVNRRGI